MSTLVTCAAFCFERKSFTLAIVVLTPRSLAASNSQAYNRIPLMLRKVANGLIAWKLKSVKEIESIFLKCVVGLSKEQFFNILEFVYRIFLKQYWNFRKLWEAFSIPWEWAESLRVGGMWGGPEGPFSPLLLIWSQANACCVFSVPTSVSPTCRQFSFSS